MSSSAAAAGLGLVSAATWGGSDFVGGIGARRAPAMLVVASGHIFSLLLLLALCQGMRLAWPGSHYLVYAALGGFEGSLALAVFYRALAMGAMGLTAALTGVLTALVPVLFSLLHDGVPTPLTMAGLALGLASIWLITSTPAPSSPATDTYTKPFPLRSLPAWVVGRVGDRGVGQTGNGVVGQTGDRGVGQASEGGVGQASEGGVGQASGWVSHPFRALCEKGGRPKPSTRPVQAEQTPSGPKTSTKALLLGALAGIGFGSQLVLFKFASGGGILWTMTSARAAGALAMILFLLVAPPKAPWRGFWFTGILAGSLDTLGNLFYLRATQVGRLDVAAVVCSLYPAGTILLAAFMLHERPTRRQFAGMALALSAVMLLSI